MWMRLVKERLEIRVLGCCFGGLGRYMRELRRLGVREILWFFRFVFIFIFKRVGIL